MALLIKLLSLNFNIVIKFEEGNLSRYVFLLPIITSILIGFLAVAFGEVIFRLFLLSFLSIKIHKKITIIILGTIIWAITFGDYGSFKLAPYIFEVIIGLVVGLLFVTSFLKWDFVTVLWGALIYYLLRTVFPLIYYDNSFFMWNGISLFLLLVLVIVIAIIGLRKNIDVSVVQKIVPDYLIRKAERARIERELEIARRVQLSFLPSVKPELKGVDIASICIPATEVGGDYYNFIKIDKHKLGIVIGDVSGKGISAAFHMTLTKGFLKSQARTQLSPREIMIHLNELFYENVERGTFISMIYGVFDLKENTFTFSRAGHNPLILKKKLVEEVDVLCPKGLALGLEKGVIFEHLAEEYKIGINTDDVFMFYTDGFSEAMNTKKEEFGEERLQNTLKNISTETAENILEHIKFTISNFVGNAPQHDDMTMLVVKIL